MPLDEDAVELARQILNAACGSTVPLEAIDLEAAVVRSLTLLTMGHAIDFRDYRQPPAHIQAWLKRASTDEVRGLLMMTLRRWHELRGK
jgi:hypothetical protein